MKKAGENQLRSNDYRFINPFHLSQMPLAVVQYKMEQFVFGDWPERTAVQFFVEVGISRIEIKVFETLRQVVNGLLFVKRPVFWHDFFRRLELVRNTEKHILKP